MNIENATNVLFRLTSFFPADLLVDIVADKNATATVISNNENKTVFSIVYTDERNSKRLITVTMQAKNNDDDARFHRYMIDVHYNGNGKVYSSLVSAEAYAELISVLFPCENVASEVLSSQSQDLKLTSSGANKMENVTNIKSQLALEIMQLPSITFDYHQDNENALLDLIESNGYCEPSQIGSTAEAYDLVWSDLAREYDYEMPDFSGCNSSLECIEAEGQAILDAVYYSLKCELVKDIAEALDECFSHKFENDLELLEMKIGRSGLGHIPHDYEVDIAEGSMCIWLYSKMVEVTTNGVTLYGKLETME